MECSATFLFGKLANFPQDSQGLDQKNLLRWKIVTSPQNKGCVFSAIKKKHRSPKIPGRFLRRWTLFELFATYPIWCFFVQMFLRKNTVFSDHPKKSWHTGTHKKKLIVSPGCNWENPIKTLKVFERCSFSHSSVCSLILLVGVYKIVLKQLWGVVSQLGSWFFFWKKNGVGCEFRGLHPYFGKTHKIT